MSTIPKGYKDNYSNNNKKVDSNGNVSPHPRMRKNGKGKGKLSAEMAHKTLSTRQKQLDAKQKKAFGY